VRRMVLLRAALCAGSLCAGAASAQDATPNVDWDLMKDEVKQTTIAYVTTTAGPIIAMRCTDGDYSALLAGLPELPAAQKTRALRLTFRDEDESEWRWNVTTDRTAAVADFPAPFARQLRKGGRLQIRIPDGAGPGRTLRYDLSLPASGGAIDETLTACGRPLVDTRDQGLEAVGESGLPKNVRWLRQIRPRFPNTRYAEGFVTVSCVAQPTGQVTDCLVEAEHPGDGRFGDAVLRAAGDARIAYDVPPAVPGLIAFRVNFIMR
jgi:hypothetical protein